MRVRRVALLWPVALLLAACAGLPAPGMQLVDRPEGLELRLHGYRFLFEGRHRLELRAAAVGAGYLYRVDGHEILIRPERRPQVDGEPVDLEPGEVYRLPAPARRKP